MAKSSTLGDYNQLAKAVNQLAEKVDNLEKSQKKNIKQTIKSNQALGNQVPIVETLSGSTTKLNITTLKLIDSLRKQNKTFKDLGISSSTVSRALQGQSQAVKELNDAYDKGIEAGALTARNTRNLGGAFSVLRSRLLLASFAVDMVRRTVGSLMKEYDELLQANLRVENTIKTTGATALLSSFEIKQLANEVESLTGVSSTLVTEASAMMLTFTKLSGQTFKDALKISIDLSKAFGQDLRTSVIQVGKALNDPILGVGALRRVGVSFSETQKNMIKHFMDMNNLASAQAVILKELETEIGGTAEAMANTPIAKWTRLWNDLMPMVRNVGVALGIIVDPIRQIGQGMADFHHWSVKLIAAWSGKTVLDKTAADAELANEAFDRFRDTFSELNERELKHFQKLAPGLNAEINLMKNQFDANGISIETFTKLMETFDFVMAAVIQGTKDYNREQEEMGVTQKKLSSFMEKFRSKDLDAEMKFQLDKAKALSASEANLAAIRKYYKDLKEESDDRDREREFQKEQAHYDQLQAQLTAFGQQLLQNQSNQLNLEMNQDIEFARNSRAFKMAQRRGDVDAIEKIEKDAAAKTLQRRKDNFKMNQLLAVSNIVIDYLQGIAKETSKSGLFGLTTSGVIMTAASAAAVAAVMAQKPPAFARGGDFTTTGPQMIMVGDNPGGRERVQVTPLSSPNIAGPQGETSITVNVSGNVMTQEFTENEIIPAIRDALRRGDSLDHGHGGFGAGGAHWSIR